MPNILKTPTTASWNEVDQNIGDSEYRITYRLNERFDPPRLYFDIYAGIDPVVLGSKIRYVADYTYKYALTELLGGIIFLVNTTGTEDTPTLGNIGIGLDYQLVYYTNQELAELLEE